MTITLLSVLRKKLKASRNTDEFTAGRPLGDTSECGPSYHRHSDKYHNKCHPIKLKHRKHGDKAHKTNPAKQKTPLKVLKVKESK